MPTIKPRKPKPSPATSARMAAIRSTGNRAEVALRKALWRLGLRYRIYSSRLPGKPDLVFASARVVIFVDGDFWHGRVLRDRDEAALRATFRRRRGWWVRKIRGNVARDEYVTKQL